MSRKQENARGVGATLLTAASLLGLSLGVSERLHADDFPARPVNATSASKWTSHQDKKSASATAADTTHEAPLHRWGPPPAATAPRTGRAVKPQSSFQSKIGTKFNSWTPKRSHTATPDGAKNSINPQPLPPKSGSQQP